MQRALIAVLVVVLAMIAAGAVYIYATKGPGTTTATQTTTTIGDMAHGQGGMMNASTCNELGDMTIGQSIKWLLDHHNVFKFSYKEYPNNKTIIWIITAPNQTSARILENHIRQMECVIKNGGTPRPNDPVFQVDAKITKDYVETNIIWVNQTTIKVVKVAANDCAYEVIKLHADIVQGFFTTGREEASQTHTVPAAVESICAPYLGGS